MKGKGNEGKKERWLSLRRKGGERGKVKNVERPLPPIWPRPLKEGGRRGGRKWLLNPKGGGGGGKEISKRKGRNGGRERRPFHGREREKKYLYFLSSIRRGKLWRKGNEMQDRARKGKKEKFINILGEGKEGGGLVL